MPVLLNGKTASYALLSIFVLLNLGRVIWTSYQYLELDNEERLYNSLLYREKEKLSELYVPPRGFSEKITNPIFRQSSYSISRRNATNMVNTLIGYSVKLISHCSVSGTGWFLDWEIPEKDKYPTKWFVATNLHVISDYVFLNDSYPSLNNTKSFCYSENWGPTQIYLVKDRKPDKSKYQEVSVSLIGTVEETIKSKAKYADTAQSSDRFVYTKTKTAKKFFIPYNFLGNKYVSYGGWRKKISYLRDFAVLEINFSSESEAKAITDNLYTKLKTKTLKEIDLLADELVKRKSGDELIKDQENYFSGGYSGTDLPGKTKISFDSVYATSRRRAGKLSFPGANSPKVVKNQHNQPIVGLINISRKAKENSKDLYWLDKEEWGYEYVLRNMDWAKPGASGSVVVDDAGQLLGILTGRYGNKGIIGVTPLRSEGMMKGSKIIFPKYDFILGTKGQIGSYRESLDRNYPNIRTNLRDKWSVKN